MNKHKARSIFIGDTHQIKPERIVNGEFITMLGDVFYKIHHYDTMAPFFITLVSSSNHWVFISSTGGLCAGRVSAEQSLFPYYTEDKLTENSENTGHKAIFLVTRDQRTSLWEPFSFQQQGVYQIERNLYKNIAGTEILFEEKNISLGLTYRYAWRTSDAFGFVKTSWISNSGKTSCAVELVDGLQNILPANVSSDTQIQLSCLLDAYKRSELHLETGLANFSLNSTLTDLAEPSESLLSTTVMQLGLDPVDYLLSSAQLEQFRSGMGVKGEIEVRGQRCAYFVHADFSLEADADRSWHLVAEVNQDGADVVHAINLLRGDRSQLFDSLEADIAANTENVKKIVASVDGLQVSNHPLRGANHFANVLFNTMRGGYFSDQYLLHTQDFIEFVSARNRAVLLENEAFFSSLPTDIALSSLQARSEASGVADLIRLSYAYLPLSFSRRHGDPSRPWNRFSINIKREDGSRQLDYEGNWRDIFQNWEALAYSFPDYVENMISTFLNITTVDGYNPYRISLQGFEWEHPQPNNPWANIGYWSDHQIIYLLKLLEISAKVHPGKLNALLVRPIFSYSNVPYRIKPYLSLLRDPFNTIDFDWELEHEIELRVQENGTDGKLAFTRNKRLLQATLAEKLLVLLLAKLVNFVPEGGIWMNTQRPEWNDANNALVGNGLSIVTVAYLRRYLTYFKNLLEQSQLTTLSINAEILELYAQILQILHQFQQVLANSFSDEQRRTMMDALGQAGSDYRWNYYSLGFSGELAHLPVEDLTAFLELALQYVDHTLRANKRSDNLYHAYNILHIEQNTASVSCLYEMLEGQVAILSSGLLSCEESVALLESLRKSQLYRADQNSYILYPDRKQPEFLQKNMMTPEQVREIELILELAKNQDRTLVIRDENGNFHFSGRIHNLHDINRSLGELEKQSRYSALVKADKARIKDLFENIFHHDEFTGRSGTFFAYEGLGSIYWHMVSKLVLAVQETILRHEHESSCAALIEMYADIRKGQNFNKSPEEYGAFPTDPYSHTPKGQGARQPGMTGLVKEEIITRQADLGWFIENGALVFNGLLLDRQEFLAKPSKFSYWDVNGKEQQLELSPGSLAYTICQVPIILQSSDKECITVYFTNSDTQQIAGHVLDWINSKHIFQRDGFVHHLVVCFPADR